MTKDYPRILGLTFFVFFIVFFIIFYPKPSQTPLRTSDTPIPHPEHKPQNLALYHKKKHQISEAPLNDSLQKIRAREAYAHFLANHPFNRLQHLSYQDLKAIPKQDRPDLGWEQDYLRTLDPQLGLVPFERKLKTLQAVSRQIKSKAAIGNVTWQERGPNNVGGRTRALLFDPTDPSRKKVWAGGVQGGLWYTDDITIDAAWTKVNDLWDNISITAIAADPNDPDTWYVGTGEGFTARGSSSTRGAGLWKTTDAGAAWTQLTTANGFFATDVNFFWVNDLVVRNESGTSVLYVSNSRLFHLDSFFPGQEGLFRSTDGGINFTQVFPDAPVGTPFVAADLEIHPANNRIYAGTTRNAFSTGVSGERGRILYSDTGLPGSWTVLDFSSTNNARRVEIACAPNDPDVVYAVAQNSSPSISDQDVAWFKRTLNATDTTQTWEDIPIPLYLEQNCFPTTSHFTRGQSFYDLILAVHPTNPDVVIAGGISLHKSVNGTSPTAGDVAWSAVSYWTGDCLPYVHADEHQILFRPDHPNEAIIGSDGGISYSIDLGSSANPTFADRNNHYNVTQFYAVDAANIAAGTIFLAGAQDNGSQQFQDALKNSSLDISGGDGAFCHIDQDDPDIRISSFIRNVYNVSNDGGQIYVNVLNNQSNGLFINPSEYDDQANILYANFSSATTITRISDIGGSNTYTNLNINFAGSIPTITALKISPNTPNVLFLGGNDGRIFKVSNAHTATPATIEISTNPLPIGSISCIEVGDTDDELLVTFFNYGISSVWETADGGTTWINKEGNLPDIPIRWALYNPNNREEVLLATELGVYSTDNFGHAVSSVPVWGISNTGLATVRCDMLKYRAADGVVVVATHGRGIFTSDVFSSPLADFETRRTWFVNRPLNFTDYSLKADSWAWDFDQNVNPGTDATTQNPSFTYTNPGTYTVQLSINSGASVETKTNYITILPEPNIPYTQDFNTNDGGFFPYPLQLAGNANSVFIPREWEWGVCNSVNFNPTNNAGTIEGANSWATSLNEDHGRRLRYALESPPFSLIGAVGDIFLEFNYRAACGTDAGFNIEYSIDGGNTWLLLGDTQSSGNNPVGTTSWYNEDHILGLRNQPGFSQALFDVFSPRYNITFLAGSADLRFRFVFGSRFNVIDGVQIDNFQIDGMIPLPIQLLSLKADRLDEQNVLLKWQTATEQNNQGFEILKSINGSDFSRIGFVDGAGDSPQKRNYSFKDPQAKEAAYYQLRQLDFAGTSSLSPVVFVEGTFQEVFSIFPNPFTENVYLNLDFTSSPDDLLKLEIWDSRGVSVLQVTGTEAQMEDLFTQKASDLPAGWYIVRLHTPRQVFTHKLVKQ
ncbi:MAG: T9SS type A sorting domain-containing protein [Microscillaceae bacterium]|nr:T9SS type A sorting domain-containing protein [Microscillaceae bacterium]